MSKIRRQSMKRINFPNPDWRRDFLIYSTLYGFKTTDYGRIIVINNTTYTIVGLGPNPLKPIMLQTQNKKKTGNTFLAINHIELLTFFNNTV